MSYDNFVKDLKDADVHKLEEDIENWRKMTPAEKAEMIKEVKESGDDSRRKYILEVNEKAMTNPGTEAGGSGDQTGDEIDPTSKGGEPKMATNMTDDDPNMSDKTKLAAASGIGSGLGALNMAKKLRREKVKTATPAS